MSDILITETTEDDEAWLYGEKDLDSQEMLIENIVLKEQDTKPLDVDTDSGEDEEDDVQVTIRDIKANPTQYNYGFKGVPFNKPLAQLPSAKFNKLGSLDIEDVGKYNNIPIFDVNLEELEEKPWRKPGSDITDYFNYGFNEESWRIYCERQKALRADNETLDKIRHMYIPQPYYLHHIPSIDPANLSAQTGLLPHLNFPPPIIPSLINTESNQGTEEFESAKANELSAESNKENAVDLVDEGKVKREDDFTDHSEFDAEEKINKSIDDHHQPSSTSTKTSGPLLEAPAASSMSSVTSMTPHHVLLAGQPLFQKTSTPAEAAAVAAKLSLPPGVNPFTVPPPGYPLLPTPDGRYNLPPPPFGGAPLPYIPGLPPLWPPPTGLPPVVISSSSGAAIGDKVSVGDRRNNSPPPTDSRRPAPYHHYPYYKPRDQQHGAYYGGGGSYHPQPYYKKTTPYGHPGGPPSKYYHQDNDEYYRRPGRGRYGGGGYKPHYASSSRYDDYYEEAGADASGDDRRRPHYRHHRNEKGGGEEEAGRPQGEIDSANPAGSSLDGPDNNQNRYGKEDSESIVVKHNRPLIDSARLEGGPSDQVPSDQQASLSTEDKFSASSRHASYYPSRRGAPGGGYPNSEYYYGKSSYDRYPENERDYRRKPYDSRIRSSRHKEGEDRSGSKRKHRRYSKERRTKQRTRSKSRSNKSSDEEETSAPRESTKRHKRRLSPSPTRKKDKHHHSKKEDEDDGTTLEDETSLSFANDLTSRGDVKSSKDQNTEQSRLDAGDESSRSSASSYRGDGVGDGRGGAGGGGEEDEDTKSDAAAVTPQGFDEKSIEGETTAPPKKSTKGGHHRKRSHRRDEKKSKRRAGGKHYHHKKSSGHRRRDRSRSTTATSRAGKRAKKERSDSRSRSNSNESRYSSARKRDKKYSHYDDIYDEKPISSAPIIDKSSLKR